MNSDMGIRRFEDTIKDAGTPMYVIFLWVLTICQQLVTVDCQQQHQDVSMSLASAVRSPGVLQHPSAPLPEFSHPPHNVTVVEGEEATLICGVIALQGHKLAWVHEDSQSILTVGRQVYAQSGRLTLAADQRRAALTLQPVTAADRGWYMCQINTDPMTAARAYLQVLVRPTIVNWSGPVLSAREGSRVELQCQVRSHPPATVTWTRADLRPVLPLALGGPVWSTEGPSLVFPSLGRGDAGPYSCSVDNGNTPPVVRTTRLEVTFAPMLWLFRERVGAKAGDDVTLECITDAFPPPDVRWMSGNTTIIDDGVKFLTGQKSAPEAHSSSSSRQSLTLELRQLKPRDFGHYTCIVENPQGRADATIRLYEIRERVIKGPPITLAPKNKGAGWSWKNHPDTGQPNQRNSSPAFSNFTILRQPYATSEGVIVPLSPGQGRRSYDDANYTTSGQDSSYFEVFLQYGNGGFMRSPTLFVVFSCVGAAALKVW